MRIICKEWGLGSLTNKEARNALQEMIHTDGITEPSDKELIEILYAKLVKQEGEK